MSFPGILGINRHIPLPSGALTTLAQVNEAIAGYEARGEAVPPHLFEARGWMA